MRNWFNRRYLDVVGSIYIYNEHRGYTAIDRVLEAVRRRTPDDAAFITRIEQHRADERKHYVMFRKWFEQRGVMPLAVDRQFGHIDRFIELLFGRSIDRLDTEAVVASDALFERLCRVVSLTERRGYRQLAILLANPIVRADQRLARIFKVIEQDEPSHWGPYDDWLDAHARRRDNRFERWIDGFIHAELLFLKLPLLFLNPWARRRQHWAD